MILSIYLTLIAVSLIIFLIGVFIEADVLKLTGAVLFFLISMVGLFASIEYESGATITTSGTTTTISPTYTAITRTSGLFSTITYHTFAFLQVLAAIGAFIFVLSERRSHND
jgi:hypothetical protein